MDRANFLKMPSYGDLKDELWIGFFSIKATQHHVGSRTIGIQDRLKPTLLVHSFLMLQSMISQNSLPERLTFRLPS
jgi:hypothetical protein